MQRAAKLALDGVAVVASANVDLGLTVTPGAIVWTGKYTMVGA